LLVNLGHDFEIECIAEPLLAPPVESGFDSWRTQWCSEDPAYGGHGCREPYNTNDGWLVPAAATVLLAPAFAASLHT
jgi:hypothetical protein